MVPELEALSVAHRIQSRLERHGLNVFVGRTPEGYMVDLLEIKTLTSAMLDQARGKLTKPGTTLLGRVRVLRREKGPELRYEGGAEALVRRHAPGLARGC